MRRILAIMLALCVAMGLQSCGGSGNPEVDSIRDAYERGHTLSERERELLEEQMEEERQRQGQQ